MGTIRVFPAHPSHSLFFPEILPIQQPVARRCHSIDSMLDIEKKQAIFFASLVVIPLHAGRVCVGTKGYFEN